MTSESLSVAVAVTGFVMGVRSPSTKRRRTWEHLSHLCQEPCFRVGDANFDEDGEIVYIEVHIR